MTTEDVVQVSYYRHGTVLETCMTEEQVQTLFSKATPHTVGERTIMLMDTPSHGVVALRWVRPLPSPAWQARYERFYSMYIRISETVTLLQLKLWRAAWRRFWHDDPLVPPIPQAYARVRNRMTARSVHKTNTPGW